MKKKVFLVILSSLLAVSMLSGCLFDPSSRSGSNRNSRSNRYDDDDDDDDDDDYDDDYDDDDDDIVYTVDDDDDINDTLVDDNDPVFANTEWADVYIYGDDYDLKAEVTPRNGIPDDFEIYSGVTFGQICTALENNSDFRDPISNEPIKFDRDIFNKVCTMFWFGPDEYKNFSISRQSVMAQLAYLATLSFEFSSDNFDPDYVVYHENDDTYEFHGVLDRNNIGRAVLVFTDANGGTVNFEDAMCGDQIVWSFNFNDPSTYKIGLDEASLSDYPTGGFLNVANYFAGIIDQTLG